MAERLAIDGGTPVIAEPIPGGMHGPSVIDEREINAVTEVPTQWETLSVR